MLAPSPIIKKTARTALSGHFLQGIAVSCVLIFACFIGELIASIVSVFAGIAGYVIFLVAFFFFAASPLALGALYFFRRLLWGQDDNVLIIFKYFGSAKEYKRALHLTLLVTIKFVCAGIILFMPCLIVWMLSSEWFYAVFDLSFPVWTSSLWTLNSFLAIIAAFALMFVMLKYYMAAFLLVCDDNMHPEEAVNMSSIISKRTGADFFGLVFNFLGWILLSIFIAPLVFTVPYFMTSYGVHCRYAIAAYNRDVDRFNAKDTPFYTVDEA